MSILVRKRSLVILGLLVLSLGICLLLKDQYRNIDTEESSETKGVAFLSFVVEGEVFDLQNGLATKSLAPESSFLPTVRIFGDPVYGDLDGDGDEDAALWLEYQSGGSGTFYYGALALKDKSGYLTTDTLFLGDRISPQSISLEGGKAAYNFADRLPEESFAVEPTVNKTVYVYYDVESGEIGEWVKDFEGEANYTERYSGQVDRVKVIFEHFNFTSYRLVTNELVRNGEMNTERGYKDDMDATVYVLDWQKEEANQLRYVRLTSEPVRLYLLNSAGELVEGSFLVLEE